MTNHQQTMPTSSSDEIATKAVGPAKTKNLSRQELLSALDGLSLEEVVELKISRFLDQIGDFFPEKLHEIMLQKIEKPLLTQIIRRAGGNQVQAAKFLGINRNTLRTKLRNYKIT